MTYGSKNYQRLVGIEGFSEALLKNHFTLYEGYVASTNKIMEALGKMSKEGKTGTPEYAELKRRFGWEFDGMRLHELYFENMGGKNPMNRASQLGKKIEVEFGSYENWEWDFRATGAMQGEGWAVLYQDNNGLNLFNIRVNEHDVGHPAGCTLLLVMDCFEHAYLADYGIKRAEYIKAFVKDIKWEAVEERLR